MTSVATPGPEIAGPQAPESTRPDREQALRSGHLERTLLTLPDVVARFDRKLRHVFVSNAVEQWSHLSAPAFLGRTNREIGMPEPAVALWDLALEEVFASGQSQALDFPFDGPDGPRWFEGRLLPEFAGDGRVEHVLAITREVTVRREREQRLAHEALHDPLTGLPNRALVVDRIKQALGRAERSGELVAVLYLDLDRFKPVNDSLGHAVGDELLVAVARRLAEAVRPADTLARLGGDEFVACCELPSPDAAVELVERLLAAVRSPVTVRGQEICVTASLGLTLATGESDHAPAVLMAEADAALYQAKRHGRNRFEVFGDEARTRIGNLHETEQHLERALVDDDITVEYQPIFDLASGCVVGVEALARWRHPTRGLVPAAQFLPLVEESSIGARITARVIAIATRDARERWAAWPHPATTWINVSARQLSHPDVNQAIRAGVKTVGIRRGLLGIEVDETVLSGLEPAALDALMSMRSATGARIGVDAFGSRQSSLAVLRDTPIDSVKVDARVAAGGPESDVHLARAVVGLGHALGAQVVASRIETAEQAALVTSAGFDLASGHHLGRPVPADEIDA